MSTLFLGFTNDSSKAPKFTREDNVGFSYGGSQAPQFTRQVGVVLDEAEDSGDEVIGGGEVVAGD